MEWLLKVSLFIAAFAGMEAVAHYTHKYVMHGCLWSLHKSHHRPRQGLFELNDLFAVYFALPSILLIWLGVNVNEWLLPVGLGMTAYGFCYFAFHDGIVHRRLPFRYRGRSSYMKRIIQAHYVHHATTTRDGAVSFGFLYAGPVGKLDAERRRLLALSRDQASSTDRQPAAVPLDDGRR